jgi:MoaA/NifB/PqqE/SkfB family radical SAM enzyme
MRHVYVETENTIYSFAPNSVVKTKPQELDKIDLKKNSNITYVEKNPIFYAGIAVTNHCNLFCKHCLINTTTSLNNHIELSIEDLSKLLHDLHNQGLARVSITGGEPFIYPHIVDFFKLLYKYNIEAKINTNGTFFDLDIIEYLINYGLDQIDVSFNDLSDDSDTYFDGINYSQKRLQNLKKLVDSFKGKVIITASNVLTKKIVNSLFEIEDILHNIGVDQWRLRELMPSYFHANQTKEIPDEVCETIKTLISKIVKFAFSERKIHVFGYLYDTILSGKITKRCENLERNYIYVDYCKNIYWFSGLKNASLGNFSIENIPQISENLTRMYQEYDIPQRCLTCPAQHVCFVSKVSKVNNVAYYPANSKIASTLQK